VEVDNAMKAIILVVLLLFCVFSLGFAEVVQVEKLTEKEKFKIEAQEKVIREQQKKLNAIKYEILKAHKIEEAEYMEWKRWAVFDGEFILVHYQNFMFKD
jgi:hypothetical protein